jgi:hypothetical protein
VVFDVPSRLVTDPNREAGVLSLDALTMNRRARASALSAYWAAALIPLEMIVLDR